MVIRLFLSAVAPSDADEVLRLFSEDVVPAFTAHPDCLGVELVMSTESGPDGMIEGGALTRWTSLEAMEAALTDDSLRASQVRIRELLRKEPIRKVYEVRAGSDLD
jgi:quinol monooxygenase YgiN